MSESGAPSGPRWQTQCGIGVALLLVAAALWYDAGRLPRAPTMGVGPAAALLLVGGLVALLGLAHFVTAWRARQAGHAHAVTAATTPPSGSSWPRSSARSPCWRWAPVS